MKKLSTIFIFLFLIGQLSAATYRNFIGYEVINGGTTLRVWIDSDTAPGETAVAELRTGPSGSEMFSGIIDGMFDDTSFPGANWFVDIPIPAGENVGDVQLATRNQSGNLYGFTNFVFPVSGLPVTFAELSTSTTAKAVKVVFTTATEENNEYFEIQRSIDSKSWTKLGQIAGAGTSSESQSYSFLDEQPEHGVNFYRIKQVDFDGTFSFSGIVSAMWNKQPEIRITPNPVSERLVLSIPALEEENVTVTITNLSGQVLLHQPWTGAAISVQQLPAGAYFLQVRTSQGLVAAEEILIQ